jgi:hypothetical protein
MFFSAGLNLIVDGAGPTLTSRRRYRAMSKDADDAGMRR